MIAISGSLSYISSHPVFYKPFINHRPSTIEEFRRDFFEWLNNVIAPQTWYYQIRIYEVLIRILYYLKQPKPRSRLKALLYK